MPNMFADDMWTWVRKGMDEVIRANAETCDHNVVIATITADLELRITCGSCDSIVTDKSGKSYEYDTTYNVWVHNPNRRVERPQTPANPEE